jgi:hypothetical protein
MQELQVWWLLHVQKVHVEPEILAGIGDVLRLRDGANVPRFALEGVLERYDAVCDLDDGLGRLWDVLEEEQAVGVEPL